MIRNNFSFSNLYKGVWHIPNKDISIVGTLIINNNTIELEVITSGRNMYSQHLSRINGYAKGDIDNSDYHITLIDATMMEGSHFSDICVVKYAIEYILIGDSKIPSLDDEFIKHCYLKNNYIDYWILPNN